MPDSASFELRIHPPFLPEDLAEIAAFLRERGLEPPGAGSDYTVSLVDAGRLVGTGSLAGRVIQGLAVDEGLRGAGIAARIVSELEAEASRRGRSRLFVFTSPGNRGIFESLGYRAIAQAGEDAILLEKGEGLAEWLSGLRKAVDLALAPGREVERTKVAALVVNCNPFTLGHLHLVRTASGGADLVVVLVVREEASSFPFDVRFRLVREGVAGLGNVIVLPGSDYIVSRATFPTYFLKDRAGEAAAIHARLDADLFGRRIAPAIGVTRRYVGEEPYSPVTAIYNKALAEVLPPLGVELVEIPRLASGGAAVSASAVRRAIREGRLESVRAIVPPSTWAYLSSPEAKPVLERVAAAEGRH
jgi:[citrate (pro-3S)-lyase] ligase